MFLKHKNTQTIDVDTLVTIYNYSDKLNNYLNTIDVPCEKLIESKNDYISKNPLSIEIDFYIHFEFCTEFQYFNPVLLTI